MNLKTTLNSFSGQYKKYLPDHICGAVDILEHIWFDKIMTISKPPPSDTIIEPRFLLNINGGAYGINVQNSFIDKSEDTFILVYYHDFLNCREIYSIDKDTAYDLYKNSDFKWHCSILGFTKLNNKYLMLTHIHLILNSCGFVVAMFKGMLEKGFSKIFDDETFSRIKSSTIDKIMGTVMGGNDSSHKNLIKINSNTYYLELRGYKLSRIQGFNNCLFRTDAIISDIIKVVYTLSEKMEL